MTKLNTKYTQALALLLVATLAPASIAFAQSSTEAETTTETTKNTTDSDVKTKTRVDVKAKISDVLEKKMDRIKDEVKTRYVVSDTLTDRGTDLTFRGHTDGWAIVGGTAHRSSIAFGGDAHHVGGGNWKIASAGELAVGDRHAKLDLSGFARGNVIHLQGSGSLDNGEAFRIMLRGHFAPTDDRNVYAVAFTNAHIQYMNSGLRVPLMQVGSVTIIDTILPATVEPVPAQ
jgi:hypothetical protein